MVATATAPDAAPVLALDASMVVEVITAATEMAVEDAVGVVTARMAMIDSDALKSNARGVGEGSGAVGGTNDSGLGDGAGGTGGGYGGWGGTGGGYGGWGGTGGGYTNGSGRGGGSNLYLQGGDGQSLDG